MAVDADVILSKIIATEIHRKREYTWSYAFILV